MILLGDIATIRVLVKVQALFSLSFNLSNYAFNNEKNNEFYYAIIFGSIISKIIKITVFALDGKLVGFGSNFKGSRK